MKKQFLMMLALFGVALAYDVDTGYRTQAGLLVGDMSFVEVTKEFSYPKVTIELDKGYVTTFKREVIETENGVTIRIWYGTNIDDSFFKKNNVFKMQEFLAPFFPHYGYGTSDFDEEGWGIYFVYDPLEEKLFSNYCHISLLLSIRNICHKGTPLDAALHLFALKTWQAMNLSAVRVSYSKKDRSFTINIPYSNTSEDEKE